ncbi:hypothetical protein [Cryobacterium sp. W22_MBD10_FK3]|uniref:hypothetical protein n=1 Tax=Cryobacterium sp. W22_MBD10_FK3 TaxID=3240273 RepID=UPI003F90277A
MSYSVIHNDDVQAGRGPHPAASPFDKRISESLNLRGFEMYKVELPPGATTELHNHLDDSVEDAYAIVRGGGWVVVDGEEIAVSAGHFVAVTEESTRFIKAGDGGCDLIAVCA